MGGFEIVAPEFEIAAPTPKLRPEDQAQIDQAIRSVPLPKPDYMQTEQTLLHPIAQPPTPVSPEAEQYQKDLRGQRQRPSAAELATGLASGAAELFTAPSSAGVSTEPGGGAQTRRGIQQIQTPGQRGTGVANLADVGLQALTPLMGPAIAENPVSIAKGFVEGGVASKAAGYLSKKAGANPEQQDLAQDLAFWMPGVARSVLDPKANIVSTDQVKGATVGVRGAGAGVAVTPESVNIGGRVGPFKGSVSIPRNGAAAAAPALEPPTIEGTQVDPSSQMLADHEVIQARAARVANGQPPVEPPPPAPTPKVTEITQDDIQHVAGLISKLPAEMRAQGLLEAHQTMARILQTNGRVVGPDGKLIIIDSPKAAEKAAADMVNNEVDRQDKAAQESQKAKPEAAQPKTETAPANRRGRRAQQAEMESKAFEVSPPAAKFEVAPPEKAEVESGNGAKPEAVGSAGNDVSAASSQQGVRNDTSGAGGVIQPTGRPVGEVVNKAEGEPAAGSTDQSELGQKPGFQKGQQVRFSKDFPVRKGQDQAVAETIPQGTPAFVEHAGEGMNFVRLRLPDGRKLSVNQRAIEQAPEGEKLSSNLTKAPWEMRQVEASSQKAEASFPLTGKVEVKDGKPVYTYSTTVNWGDGERTFDIQAKGPLNGTEQANRLHKKVVEEAVKSGKPVPDEVLKDYPELQKKASAPEPGQVGTMKISDLKLAPNKFQYKLGTDAEGVSSLLKEQDRFKPDLAGVVSVWRDPEDKKMYVINGHHRYELAKRTGQKEIAVRHIVAPDAQRARSIGALQNIAEGRGTPIDAAKFFRDSGMTPERLKEEGVSLGEATGKQGLALSRLDTPLFNKVVSGDLRLGRAVAIGEATGDPAEQKAILGLVDKKEARGQKISDGVLSELIRFVKESGREQETTADLFGSQQVTKSLALEKAEISDYIRQQLSKDRKLFGYVSKEGRAEELSRAGNKIDVNKSKEISTGAAQAEEVYNRLSARGGDIADILDQSAKRLAGKDNPATVKSDAYKSIREAVQKALSGGAEAGTQGREGVSRSGGESPETTSGTSKRNDAVSLFHFSDSPQFKNTPLPPIGERSPEAWATVAKAAKFDGIRPSAVRPYVRMNTPALVMVGHALHASMLGGSVPPKYLPDLYKSLESIHSKIEAHDKKAADNLGRFIDVLREHSDDTAGLTFIADMGNPERELSVLHEEQFHAMVQSPKYGGNRGVPWREMVNDPGVLQMADRITLETRTESPVVIVAEAVADIAVGTYTELSAKQAYSTASRYYELVAEKHGAEPLDAAQQVYDYIDQEARDRGMIPANGQFNAERTKSGRQALADVRQRLRDGKIAQRGGTSAEKSEGGSGTGGGGRGLQSTGGNGTVEGPSGDTGRSTGIRPQPVSGESAISESGRTGLPVSGVGEGHGKLREATAGSRGEVSKEANRGELAEGAARGNGDDQLRPGEREAGAGTSKGTTSLAASQPIGLSDEELQIWAKSKNFHIEPAGEQGDLFGEPKKIFRVSRNYGGEYQTGLVYEDQLEKAGLGTNNQQESLFSPEISKAVENVKGFLEQEVEDTRRAKELQWEMYDLDKRHEGRVLRAKQLLEKLQRQGVTQEDREAIDDHLDALEADSDSVPVPSLTPKQDEILDKVLLPLKEEAEAAFKKVTEGGMTIPNYNPRQTKGKGGMLDRFLAKQGQRWSGRGNLLSKQMPAAKHRVMMALENEGGERKIVSIKGGQVTAWKDGQPENIGGLSHTQEGRAFEDSEGHIWTLKQATKNEIERDSNVKYYHDAAASTIVNWLQAKKAEAAHDFIENFKRAPEFHDLAMKTGEGNPPKGWRTTNLPQFKGYYFEPHTAEVFDWFFDRLKSGDPDAFGAINSFMRARILLNPFQHPLNILSHAFIQRGVSGFLPNRMYRLAKTGARAMNAVWNQNQDYIDALESGGALQSAHDATRDLVKLFYEQMADAADKGEPWATKAAKAIGFPPTTLVHMLHSLSSKIAWPASDMMFLQAAYEYQDTHPGVSLKDSFREVGRIIPEYRLPVRILNSTTVGKIMGSKWGTIFGSYHYGELRAFSESMKSAFGGGEAKPGQSKVEDVAKGWDRLAMMALGMVLLGGAVRKLVQELSGEKDAEPTYPGVFGLLHAAERVGRKEETPTQAITKVVTPNPATMLVTQLAFNRDFQNGRHIYDPAAKWDIEAEQLMHYLKENVSPMGSEIERAEHTDQGWKKLAWNQVDVKFPKHGAEALAQQIASSKLDTSAMTTEERDKHYARQKAVDALRRGDSSALEEGLDKGQLTAEDISKLLRRSTLTGLADKVHNFTFEELTRVYEKADDEQQEELLPLLLEKQEHLLEQGRLEEAGVTE